jgi:hypothetical protein
MSRTVLRWALGLFYAAASWFHLTALAPFLGIMPA